MRPPRICPTKGGTRMKDATTPPNEDAMIMTQMSTKKSNLSCITAGSVSF